MTGFDAERYLRLLGERLMVDVELAETDRSALELDSAAAALVVGGVIDESRATQISGDYALATELVRHPGRAERSAQARRRLSVEDPPDLAARRVFTPKAGLDLPTGALRVDAVTLSQDRAAIEGVLVVTAIGSVLPRGLGTALTISAAGQSQATHFSGDVQGDTLTGLWECELTIPPEVDWLEVDGCRLVLHPGAPTPGFSVQRFSSEERLQRYLWLLVSSWGRELGERATEAGLAALRAAGLLDRGDAAAAALRWSGPGRRRDGPDPLRVTGPLPDADIQAGVPGGSGPGTPGSTPRVAAGGTVAIGAVSPRFDGVMVAIDSLTLDERGVTAEVEVSGATSPHRFAGYGQLDVKPISWWIADDDDNRYIAEIVSATSSGLHTRAKVRFGVLKGQPTLLTITAATPGAAATIRIGLQWP